MADFKVVLFIALMLIFLPRGFAENPVMHLRSIVVSINSSQAETLSESVDPVKHFKGQDVSEIGPLELAGVLSLLMNEPLDTIMKRHNNFDPEYGDENGPWLVALPRSLVQRFERLDDDDFDKLLKGWDAFKREPQNALLNESDTLSDITPEQLIEHLLFIKTVCAESLSTNNDVFLWVNVEF